MCLATGRATGGLALILELPPEHERGLKQGDFPDPLSGLLEVSGTRCVDTCDPGQEPEREEPGTPPDNPSVSPAVCREHRRIQVV